MAIMTVVPKEGVEPSVVRGLNPLCLPIPPFRHICGKLGGMVLTAEQ